MVGAEFYKYLQLLRMLFEGIRYEEANKGSREKDAWREIAIWNMSAA